MSGAGRVAVFVGPSLPACERPNNPAFDYLPPARRGDVADASRYYHAILLIDGVFQDDLAPTPKELFAATQSSVTFGAASMGALRAAECRPYGMRALGTIALWYVHERLDGDDEVALLFDPVTERALTVPNVNVRYLARCAVRRGILNEAEAADFIETSRNIFYAERDWVAVIEGAPARARAKLAQLAPLADLKKFDALFGIRHVARRLDRWNQVAGSPSYASARKCGDGVDPNSSRISRS